MDRARSGRPTVLAGRTVERILFLTTERVPLEATHWSTRLMARYADVTQWQVRQVWQAAAVKPHRLKTFTLSHDPQFAEQVIDVVGLYLDAPDNALVLSVDEKTQIQALVRTHPDAAPAARARRAPQPRRQATRDHESVCGPSTSRPARFGRITRRHRATEFRQFLAQIDPATPADLELHLIVDNSSTHTTQAIRDFLATHSRFHLHFTPTSASWLNAVETWFGQLERRALWRGIFTSVTELREVIRRVIETHNTHAAKPFRWTKSAHTILDAVDRAREALRKDTSRTGHWHLSREEHSSSVPDYNQPEAA